jgi:hypothetical protein
MLRLLVEPYIHNLTKMYRSVPEKEGMTHLMNMVMQVSLLSSRHVRLFDLVRNTAK